MGRGRLTGEGKTGRGREMLAGLGRGWQGERGQARLRGDDKRF